MAFKVRSSFTQKLLYFKNSPGVETEGRGGGELKSSGYAEHTEAELKFDQAEKRQEPIS
jgi:hypothetical protein